MQINSIESTKEARGKRLRYIRKDLLGLTRLEFQNHHQDLKITATVLHNWEEARYSGIKEGNVNLILRALIREKVVCEKDWLLYGVGNPPTICLDLDAGSVSNLRTNPSLNEDEIIRNEFKVFKEFYIDSIDTIIHDEALTPYFKAGDYVAGIRLIGNDINKSVGHLCIAQTQTGLLVTRKVELGTVEGSFNLIPTNPHFTENLLALKNIKLFSAAPIVLWRRPLYKLFSDA